MTNKSEIIGLEYRGKDDSVYEEFEKILNEEVNKGNASKKSSINFNYYHWNGIYMYSHRLYINKIDIQIVGDKKDITDKLPLLFNDTKINLRNFKSW